MPRGDADELSTSLLHMQRTLQENTRQSELHAWYKEGEAELTNHMRGDKKIEALCGAVVGFLARYLNAQTGFFYSLDGYDKAGNNNELRLTGAYAVSTPAGVAQSVAPGQGLVGQVFCDNRIVLLHDIPAEHARIHSSFLDAPPKSILLCPVLFEEKVTGVIELGSLYDFAPESVDFLASVQENIGVFLHTAKARLKLDALLEDLQLQNEEMEAQQEELRATNEKLEVQRRDVERKNRELNDAQAIIEQKMKEIQENSRYKSQFLANMSHELRTPLNSLLLLSKMLAENPEKHLSEKEVEFATTIHDSGSELLAMINEILDLAKVEAGKMELNLETVVLEEFALGFERSFSHLCRDKGLDFRVEIDKGIPRSIYTDGRRLGQIIKNLLSNSLKFTTQGELVLAVGRPAPGAIVPLATVPDELVAFSVRDTGIGIPKEKQQLIFEAFKQADGTTSRHYGGTGLGLSICREFSKLLAGTVLVESEPGQGSTFTLYLPENHDGTTAGAGEDAAAVADAGGGQKALKMVRGRGPEGDDVTSIRDDRRVMQKTDGNCLLLIEDDAAFARILTEMARDKGFQVILADDGEAGLHMALMHRPRAIILDVTLPRMDGWQVMRRLKDDPETSNIPVHFISALDEEKKGLSMGAVGWLTKPVLKEDLEGVFHSIEQAIGASSLPGRMLLLMKDADESRELSSLLAAHNIETEETGECDEALALLENGEFGVMLVDKDAMCDRLLQMEQARKIPILFYSDKDLLEQDPDFFAKYADKVIIRTERSRERIIDEVTLFLHALRSSPAGDEAETMAGIETSTAYEGKKILLVDDDMRTAFALSSLLQKRGMQVTIAKDGGKALDVLQDGNVGFDLVLMDIMMPVMDGYSTMEAIRKSPGLHKIPIIALTAKAMRGDRRKCIDAGASDYLAKPVEIDKLLTLMRVWLYK